MTGGAVVASVVEHVSASLVGWGNVFEDESVRHLEVLCGLICYFEDCLFDCVD